MVFAVTRPARRPAADPVAPVARVAPVDPGRALLFQAFRPAVRLAVEAGVPFDAVRDLLLRRLADASVARHGQHPAAGVLGRTVRQLRNLRRLGAEPRGENYVERAEAVLRAEGPLSLAELAQRLPRYYAFDAARVALDALVAQGRVIYRPPAARRGGPGTYAVVAPPTPSEAPADHADRERALAGLMRAVGDGLGGAPPLTARARLRPADLARLLDEAEAWLAAREASAAGRPDAVEVAVYVGAAAGPPAGR